mgnify:CR=1 FL=1
MSVLNENTLLGASGAGGDYEIEQSLRFDDGRGTYLERTPTVAGNRKTWTWSGWVKASNSGTDQTLFTAEDGSNSASTMIVLKGAGQLQVWQNGNKPFLRTNAVYRDPSSWWHIVVSLDTTQSTASNRLKVYVNGSIITSFSSSTYPDQNQQPYINAATRHDIGNKNYLGSDSQYFNGYLGEINFIDGQALTPDSFGETGDYGEWKPTKYAGTYGTNGFYLPFEQDYTVEGFSTVVYEGNQNSSTYIGGTGFQPDLVWGKNRSSSSNHWLFDSVRGTTKMLQADQTNAEETQTGVTAFDTDGFTLGTWIGSTKTGDDYVAWNWDMGGTTSSNTSGSITSSVRANTTYGQSIVSWTGNGLDNVESIGHGLSSKPEMVIVKDRDATYNWYVDTFIDGVPDKHLELNSTGATNSWKPWSSASTTLLTSIGSAGTGWWTNNTNDQIAYCFHSVTGYSKFGSYSGNGSTTGPVVTTGFSPAFVMIKRTDAVDNWIIMDNTRDPYNPADKWLYPNGSFEEYDGATRELDFLANGFQPKAATTEFNASGGTYIYAAFADTREYAYWYDQSGNNNDWTSEGGLTESDVMLDSPTNNFSTMNPLVTGGGVLTLAEGNLAVSGFGSARQRHSTMMPSSGKWYAEFLCTAAPNDVQIGIANDLGTGYLGNTANSWGIISANGNRINADIQSSYGTSYSTGDIIGVALDLDNGKVFIAENNTYNASGNPVTGSNPMYSSLSGAIGFAVGSNSTLGNVIANFGQDSSFAGNKTPQGNADSGGIGDFFYPVPSGFLALCTANLPSVDVIPSENFNTVLYTGTGTTQSVAGVGFQPDFTWLKSRSAAGSNNVFDVVRGAPYRLYTNGTGAEDSPNQLTSFDSDGFTLASGNNNGATYVGWNWKAGGSASSNSNGTITSQVSANVDAGFSVVSYTGNGSAGATIGHGLGGVIPELVINKRRTSASEWWIVYHSSVCTGDDNWLALNTTGALRSGGESMYDVSGFTSTTFGVNAGSGVNVSGATQIAYCFHSVESYSKVGSYVGNGNANGPMVNCGFFPNFVMIKRTDSGSHWEIHDIAREPNNVKTKLLNADQSNAEDNNANSSVDFISNGFKLRTSHAERNASGGTYIYAAFAESPFKNSNAR